MSELTKSISPISRILGIFDRTSDLIKTISSEGSIQASLTPEMATTVRTINNLLRALSPIKPSAGLATVPSRISEVLSFAKSAAGIFSELRKTFDSKVIPPVDKILAVTDSKDPEMALDEFASNISYGTIAGASAVSQARVQMLTVNKIINSVEDSEMDLIDQRLTEETYNSLPTDADSFHYKAEHAMTSLLKISPNSYIAHSGMVQMHQKLENWNLVTSRYGLASGPQNMAGVPTRMGGTPVTFDRSPIYTVPGAVSVLTGSVEDAPLGIFRNMATLAGSLNGHPSFPPKSGCYKFELLVEMKVTTSDDMGAPAYINVVSGHESGNTIVPYATYKWLHNHGVATRHSTVKFTVPYDGSQFSGFEMWISGSVAGALASVVVETTVTDIIGIPQTHRCAEGEIDYRLAGETGIRFLQSGDRWSSLLGKVQRDTLDDPNYSLRSLWHARLASDSTLIEELIDSALEY
jgi:hypothetical protein